MKNVVRSIAVLIVASLTAAGLTVAVSTAQATEAKVTVAGAVTDRDGYPLTGIRVDLMAGDGDGGTIVKTVYTNDVGRYRTKISPDAARSAWPSDPTGNHIGTSVGFEINPAGTTKVPTIKLYKAAVVRGSVKREDGVGTAGLVVTVDTVGSSGQIVGVTPSGRFQALVMPGTVVVSYGDTSGVYASQCLDGSVPGEGEDCGKGARIKVTQGQTVTLDPFVLTVLNQD